MPSSSRRFLSPLYSPPKPLVDIVAVHGLNPWGADDHATSTWRASNGALWLETFLPHQIPEARILLYSYMFWKLDHLDALHRRMNDHEAVIDRRLTQWQDFRKENPRKVIKADLEMIEAPEPTMLDAYRQEQEKKQKQPASTAVEIAESPPVDSATGLAVEPDLSDLDAHYVRCKQLIEHRDWSLDRLKDEWSFQQRAFVIDRQIDQLNRSGHFYQIRE